MIVRAVCARVLLAVAVTAAAWAFWLAIGGGGGASPAGLPPRTFEVGNLHSLRSAPPDPLAFAPQLGR